MLHTSCLAGSGGVNKSSDFLPRLRPRVKRIFQMRGFCMLSRRQFCVLAMGVGTAGLGMVGYAATWSRTADRQESKRLVRT